MPDITIKTLEGKTFDAYCAMPEGGHGPGLIVIQEIFGVNGGMRQICDDFAKQGYIAVCPDLFWRQQPGIQLTDQTPAEWDRAFELYKNFDVEAGVRDVLATLGHIRGMPGCAGKVGAVGYCLGGNMAFLTAARCDVDATVCYYGVGIETMLAEVHDIRMPTLIYIAELDQYTPQPVREKIIKGTARNKAIEVFVYDGVDHAFARPNGKNYNKAAADLANQRTAKFFAEHLHS